MNEKSVWTKYYIHNRMRDYWNGVMEKTKINAYIDVGKFDRRRIDCGAAHDYIRTSILESKPIMVSRFGCFESRCIGEGIGIEYGILKKYRKATLQTIHNNAGVFPYGEKAAQRFYEITKSAMSEIDLLGVWTTEMQDYLVDRCCPENMQITELHDLEPFFVERPWTEALEKKKVLVVHPFKHTIIEQYRKRDYLFENKKILPEFELSVVQAVQTIAGSHDERFDEWEQALNYMFSECLKYEFDVALIGCGAYGMPLAAMLKKAGKIAIHLGGVTQVLFGIKGGRWDQGPMSELYNEYWCRPSETERPSNANNVEGACYW